MAQTLKFCCDKQLFIEIYNSATSTFQQKEMQSDIELILNLTIPLIWD